MALNRVQFRDNLGRQLDSELAALSPMPIEADEGRTLWLGTSEFIRGSLDISQMQDKELENREIQQLRIYDLRRQLDPNRPETLDPKLLHSFLNDVYDGLTQLLRWPYADDREEVIGYSVDDKGTNIKIERTGVSDIREGDQPATPENMTPLLKLAIRLNSWRARRILEKTDDVADTVGQYMERRNWAIDTLASRLDLGEALNDLRMNQPPKRQ